MMIFDVTLKDYLKEIDDASLLTAEEEYEGADLSIHKIGATPEREVSW